MFGEYDPILENHTHVNKPPTIPIKPIRKYLKLGPLTMSGPQSQQFPQRIVTEILAREMEIHVEWLANFKQIAAGGVYLDQLHGVQDAEVRWVRQHVDAGPDGC